MISRLLWFMKVLHVIRMTANVCYVIISRLMKLCDVLCSWQLSYVDKKNVLLARFVSRTVYHEVCWQVLWFAIYDLKVFPRNYVRKITHLITMFLGYEISFYVLGGKITIYDFKDVTPRIFTITFMWPLTILEWVAPLHHLCGVRLNVQDQKLWLVMALWTWFLGGASVLTFGAEN